MKSYFIVFSVVLLFLLTRCADQDSLLVYDMRVENLQNPLGIDKTFPRFSWKIKSQRNGTEQRAFQILVAGRMSLLENDEADLWNSGKIESSNSVLVAYMGEILHPGSVAYWKVRVWDESGSVSPWSAVSELSIGLLNEEDWHAFYIGYPSENGFSECPQLKRSFEINDIGGKFLLYVNSLGYHEVYINGEKAGDGVLAPAVSQFDKRSMVITYDVSSLLRNGRNDLVLWLGSGWYSEGFPGVVNQGPLVKAQLENSKGRIRELIVVTDTSWLGRKSGYTRTGNWRPWNFGGETVNGEWAKNDLSFQNTDDRVWKPVSVVAVPPHIVSPQMTECNKITETIKAVSVTTVSEKEYLIDMGKNLTGWIEIHFTKLQKDQEVLIEYCDHLDENGQFVNQKQSDQYIASGEGREVFINKFNYHGFRYIRISNLDEVPHPDSITACLIHTNFGLASDFKCSDPDLNKIHDMIFYTIRCLSLGGYLVDCPQIERLGYGGDGNASTSTAQTMFNLSPLYSNWLQAWDDCIREDGGMPHTAPNPYPAGGGPYWCGFIITASWNTFLNYGDTLLLKKYYPTMQKWLGYVDTYTVDGLLRPWPDTDYRGWYLGDWATPVGIDQKAQASVDIVNNCFIAVCFDNMQKIAGVLGKTSDGLMYAKKLDMLRKRIHQEFFDESRNSYATGTQIDLSYPLLADVVPEEFTDLVTNNLIYEIEHNRNGHFACGLVGIPVFTEWTIKNNAPDLMYSMLKKREYPGYLYMIDNGGTTTWEHWDGDRSRIHNCYNGIGSWFYQAVGGIIPDENFTAYRKVIIQPQIPKGITWAKTSKETPYGLLVVNWEIREKLLEMELEIPVGINAGIVIPSGIKKYKMGGKDFDLSGEEPDTIEIKSGKYKIVHEVAMF